MVKVVNKRTHKPQPGQVDVYIGRGSPLGNPWTHIKGRMTLARHVADSKDDAIEKCIYWQSIQLEDEKSDQYKEFRRIVKIAMDNDVNLVCYCAPARCHGDHIKRLIENLTGKL